MRILFTSDVHEELAVLRRFVGILDQGPYDAGVISGDLQEYDLTLDQMRETPGVVADDLLDELHDPGYTIEELEARIAEFRADPETVLAKTVRHREKGLRSILGKGAKPIIIVRGNHDLSTWKTFGRIKNVEGRSFAFQGFTFVGYRWTSLEIDEAEDFRRCALLRRRLRARTILVSHAPPFGVLDANHRGVRIGSRALAGLHEDPRVVAHLFGHVHKAFGHAGKAANGAYPGGRRFISVQVDLNGLRCELVDPESAPAREQPPIRAILSTSGAEGSAARAH